MNDLPGRLAAPAPRPSLAGIGAALAPIPDLARAGVQRLCSNESPFGPSPAAIEAASQALRRGNEYPEGEGGALIEALAARHGISPSRLRLGPGSDTLLLQLVMAFAGPGDEVVFSARGYARYARNALIAGATPVPAPDIDFRADPAALLAAVTPRTRLVMLANPDNPSGAMLPLSAITALHAALPSDVLLVLDGAYAEFVRDPSYGDGGLSLAAQADNVIASRTFSKIHGMAGIRLGWVCGAPDLLAAMGKAGPTFPVSVPALAAGLPALNDAAQAAAARAHNDHWLPWISEALAASPKLRVRPSQANFVLIDFPSPAMVRACAAHLAAQDILVRPFGPGPHESQLRISIGAGPALERAAALILAFLADGG